MPKERIIIMGAAGRDFHNFNVYYRNNPGFEVVAFTATQIPNIDDRKYPRDLAGDLYPDGIPIYGEEELESLIKELNIDNVVFSYSDVSHDCIMQKAAQVNALGANFTLLGVDRTMIKSVKPVISICAVRTGCGKSQTTRKVIQLLKSFNKKVVAIRHPMPYGDLAKQAVQRFARYEDLDEHDCTIEEREEYEPHINAGIVVYAGVDYERILREAEKEADIIIWDGGNNDTSFYKSDLEIVVADPLRVGDEMSYYPGHTNLRRAHVIVINKIDSASLEEIEELRRNIHSVNPNAVVIDAASPITVDDPEYIRGKRVLVIEDGPTLTHGESLFGAGIVAAEKFGAVELVDPRPFAVGSIIDTFEKYPHIQSLLPAMGYGPQQVKDLQETINRTDCDIVVSATPINLNKIVDVNKRLVNVNYELEEIGFPKLIDTLKDFVK